MGASLRVLKLFGTALYFVGTVATVGLVSRITGIATPIWAVTAAASVGAIARVRALVAGMIALGKAGGTSAVLAALRGIGLAM